VTLGVSQVTEDLAAEPLSNPMWALGPTFGRMLFVGTTWFIRPFIEAAHSKQVARSVAFACLNVVLTFVTTAAFIWACLIASDHWFDNLALQILTVAVLLTVGGAFVVPLLSLLIIPLTLILALPIDLLFPLKKDDKTKEIGWCKNCEHYRQSKRYEDIIGGLWRAESMPHSSDLPCDISEEVSKVVWERYFLRELNSRALYPKDCPFFRRRA
jgi:hypothetical protein